MGNIINQLKSPSSNDDDVKLGFDNQAGIRS